MYLNDATRVLVAHYNPQNLSDNYHIFPLFGYQTKIAMDAPVVDWNGKRIGTIIGIYNTANNVEKEIIIKIDTEEDWNRLKQKLIPTVGGFSVGYSKTHRKEGA